MKNAILLFALSLITSIQIQAQNTLALVDNNVKSERTYSKVVDAKKVAKAKFEKVEDAVIQELQSNLKYPEVAYEYNVEGTVLIQFSFDGNINDLKIKKSLGAGCDEAALEALQNFPKLYQEMGGETNGSIQVTIPFVFEM